MTKLRVLSLVALATLFALALHAQDIAGSWQGTLKAGSDNLRVIVEIGKADGGGWKASAYSIDQTTDAIPVTSVSLEGSTLKLTIAAIHGAFEGKLSPDAASIDGTWTQGKPLPLKLERASSENKWPLDSGSHSVQFIAVDKDVKLEVLDWGGSGRPLVLLTGLGNNAHVFDKFAPKLTGGNHVYGITRRGYGKSSSPATGYSADRLGDDVLAVLDELKLERPVLVAHSIGGEELSSIGSRHPERVAGLVYLDAAYRWAFYDPTLADGHYFLGDLLAKLELLQPGKGTGDPRPVIQELLETGLPEFERDLRELQKDIQSNHSMLDMWTQPMPPAMQAIVSGTQRYRKIPVPTLAIFAVPKVLPSPAAEARDEANTAAQIKAFESGVPTARVVRLAHANHYVFLSNEGDVLREINSFLVGLEDETRSKPGHPERLREP